MSNNHSISFSIIIPTLNEEKNIATVISQFKALDGAFRYEVLVGDGGSTDRTIEIAGQLGSWVRLSFRILPGIIPLRAGGMKQPRQRAGISLFFATPIQD
jgi:cellulose synthase/poly-beta-1,6-N-acetylglucosamine synthase-like glycosyltransferase